MTTAEKIAVMQAFEDGKAIQYKRLDRNSWVDCSSPVWNWNSCIYRIKPEPKKPTYRPYKDTYEMIADYEERFCVKAPPYAMPSIWVKKNDFEDIYLINAYTPIIVYMYSGWVTLKVLNEGFVYLDGSPVGKLVEE